MPGHLRPVDGPNPIRVVLADAHAPVRRGLRLLLDREEDLKVVAEASDLESAIRQVGAHRPHVLVVDLRMADGSSTERIQRLGGQFPRTAIVVITMHDSAMFADQALKAGAIGVVLKDTADQELAEAVRRAARGLDYISRQIRRR